MVAQGWAVAYRQYSRAYVKDEERAHTARLGIWSGRFVMPAVWRASNR
jgi:endonuclease YncB( thermonuclease family)